MLDSQGFDLRSLFGVLRRQLRLIVGTVVIVMVASALVVFSLTPVYTATTLVLVDTTHKNLLSAQADGGADSFSDSSRVDSEVELAQSETVLLRVINDAKLLNDPEFAPEPSLTERVFSFLHLRNYSAPTGADLLDTVLAKLRDSVTVQRRALTFLISISARADSPEEAAKLANALAQTYISEQLDGKIDSMLSSRDIIQSRLTKASADVAASEDAVDTFIGSNISAIAEETGRTDLSDMFKQIESATSTRTQLSTLVEGASVNLRDRDWAALSATLKSDALAALESRRKEIDASLQTAAAGSSTVVDLRAELARVENELNTSAQAEIGGLKAQITSVQTQAATLKDQLRSDVLSSSLSSSTLTRIYELQQNAEIARSQYQTLLTRLKDLDQQASLQVADSRIASTALPPVRPSFPNPKLLLAIAGIGALGLGIGLAFLFENFVGGIISSEQLQAVVKSRRASEVPKQKEQRNALSVADAVITAPLSVYSEAVRRVRIAIDQALTRAPGDIEGIAPIILVTSAASNEGKSTVALSLARAYAVSGKRVLLIDCDLRKPSLHKLTGLEGSSGLIDYLGRSRGRLDLAAVLDQDKASGASLLVGSRRSDVATDQFIAGSGFAELIESSRRMFDIVVLDAPPVGAVVDAVYMARFATAIVFIVRWASTGQVDVRTAVNAMTDAAGPGIEIIPVLNQSDINRRRKKYDEYYTDA